MSLVDNKKIHFNYEVLEKLEAGIELLGFEVKSLRAGKANLEGAHVSIRGKEAFVVGMAIEPYQANNTPADYERDRTRKLLLNKAEIKHLEEVEGQKGLTIVPISVYNNGRKIKVSIAVVRGKKKFDKRESIKKRETDIDIRREMKR